MTFPEELNLALGYVRDNPDANIDAIEQNILPKYYENYRNETREIYRHILRRRNPNKTIQEIEYEALRAVPHKEVIQQKEVEALALDLGKLDTPDTFDFETGHNSGAVEFRYLPVAQSHPIPPPLSKEAEKYVRDKDIKLTQAQIEDILSEKKHARDINTLKTKLGHEYEKQNLQNQIKFKEIETKLHFAESERKSKAEETLQARALENERIRNDREFQKSIKDAKFANNLTLLEIQNRLPEKRFEAEQKRSEEESIERKRKTEREERLEDLQREKKNELLQNEEYRKQKEHEYSLGAFGRARALEIERIKMDRKTNKDLENQKFKNQITLAQIQQQLPIQKLKEEKRKTLITEAELARKTERVESIEDVERKLKHEKEERAETREEQRYKHNLELLHKKLGLEERALIANINRESVARPTITRSGVLLARRPKALKPLIRPLYIRKVKKLKKKKKRQYKKKK